MGVDRDAGGWTFCGASWNCGEVGGRDKKMCGERGEMMGLRGLLIAAFGGDVCHVMVLVGMRLGSGGRRFESSGSIC